jgi:hypothetical protein
MLSYRSVKTESALMVDEDLMSEVERGHKVDYASTDPAVQGSDEPEDPDNVTDPVVIRSYLESIPDAGD